VICFEVRFSPRNKKARIATIPGVSTRSGSALDSSRCLNE
jgi:hypothetical protein